MGDFGLFLPFFIKKQPFPPKVAKIRQKLKILPNQRGQTNFLYLSLIRIWLLKIEKKWGKIGGFEGKSAVQRGF